jgi:hypothetical protein
MPAAIRHRATSSQVIAAVPVLASCGPAEPDATGDETSGSTGCSGLVDALGAGSVDELESERVGVPQILLPIVWQFQHGSSSWHTGVGVVDDDGLGLTGGESELLLVLGEGPGVTSVDGVADGLGEVNDEPVGEGAEHEVDGAGDDEPPGEDGSPANES